MDGSKSNQELNPVENKKFAYSPRKFDPVILIAIDIIGLIVALIMKDYFLSLIFIAYFALGIANLTVFKKMNLSLKTRSLINRIASIPIGILFLIYLYLKIFK